MIHLLDSRTGRALRALKSGTTMPEAMGVDTFRMKVTAFVLAALLASISGWLFAHFQRSVNPSPFGLKMGIEYLFMAVIGGVGHVWGASRCRRREGARRPAAGVAAQAARRLRQLRVIVFGILLVLVLQYARDGVWAFIECALPKVAARSTGPTPPRCPSGTKPAHGELVLDVKRCARSSAAWWRSTT
jgi:branched-chain amino acid transport system permease protein